MPETSVGDEPRDTLELDALVERTRGPRPWRRLFHLANGAVVAGALSRPDVPKVAALVILGAVVAALLALDWVRLRDARANEVFFKAFVHLASPREARGVASSTWYALALLVVVAFFPRPAAVSGILVLAAGDPAAGWVGRKWGRRRFLGGTLEGSAVFAATAFLILALRHPLPMALVVALVAAVAERVSWPLDDNLAVPVTVAGLVTLLGALA
jgi:dolichol kinase